MTGKNYSYLDQQHLLPGEQRRCQKRSRGTNVLCDIDSVVIKEVNSRKKDLLILWIDYKVYWNLVKRCNFKVKDKKKAFGE